MLVSVNKSYFIYSMQEVLTSSFCIYSVHLISPSEMYMMISLFFLSLFSFHLAILGHCALVFFPSRVFPLSCCFSLLS